MESEWMNIIRQVATAKIKKTYKNLLGTKN